VQQQHSQKKSDYFDLSPIDENKSFGKINWNLTPINLLGIFVVVHYPWKLANFSPSQTLKEAP
jgi:hypothetical protein